MQLSVDHFNDLAKMIRRVHNGGCGSAAPAAAAAAADDDATAAVSPVSGIRPKAALCFLKPT